MSDESTSAEPLKLDDVIVYAIRSPTGEWFRKMNRRGWAEWYEAFNDAMLFVDVARAKSNLSKAARSCTADGPFPEILEFRISFLRVVDQTERIRKNRERAAKAAVTREKNEAKRSLEYAQQAVENAKWHAQRAQEELDRQVKYVQQAKAKVDASS